jgi:hypothetical protein
MTTSAKAITSRLKGAFSSFSTEDIVRRCKSPNLRAQREPESNSSSFSRSNTPSPVKPKSPLSERKPIIVQPPKPNEETLMLQDAVKKLTMMLNKEKKQSVNKDIKYKEAENQYKSEITKLKKELESATIEIKKLRGDKNQLLADRKSIEIEIKASKSSQLALKKQLESLASSFTQLFDFVLSKIYFSLSQASEHTRNTVKTLVKNLVDKIDETHKTTKVNLSEDLRKIQSWGLLNQETASLPTQDYEYIQDEEDYNSTFFPPSISPSIKDFQPADLHPMNPLKALVSEDDELFSATTYNKMNAVAVAGFIAEEPNQLDLNVGDAVEVISKHESEWWLGLCNGRVGIFPSECVKLK